MARAYKLKGGVNPKDIPILPYMLLLMMSIDAMRSAVRWIRALKEEKTLIANTDLLMGTIALCGWAWEGISLLKKGCNKKRNWISREMLEGDEQSLEHWDKIVPLLEEKDKNWPEGPMKKILDIRNQCFGHWDPRIARDWIARQSSTGCDVPFIESETGGFLDTRFTWANEALASALCRSGQTVEAQRRVVDELVRFSMSTTRLLSYLATGLTKKHNLEFEEVVP